MQIKKIFLLLFLILPVFAISAENFNIGLVDGIWLSNTNLFAGDETFINAVVFNNSEVDIAGIVIFYDNDKEFFQKKIVVKKNTLELIKAPHTVIVGTSYFTASISNVIKLKNNQEVKEIILKNKFELGTKKIEIDFDTDGDNIGNIKDLDDDNDGYSDKKEIEKGSNPLEKNSTPENIEKSNIEKMAEKVKITSSAILTRAEIFRKNTADIIEQEIKEQEKKNIQQLTNDSLKKENISEHKQLSEKVEPSLYIKFLKFLNKIFNSIILSAIFFIIIIWILYKLMRMMF